MNDSTFDRLYPDVDPTTPLPPTRGERIGMTLSATVFAFGAAAGDLLVAGVGFALLMFCLVANSLKMRRKIRNEARSRFPSEDWAEYGMVQNLRLDLLVPLLWLIAVVVCALVFFFTPAGWYPWAPAGAAVLTGTIVWFLPGMSPIWSSTRPTDSVEEARPSPGTPPYPNPSREQTT
ncbi:hypothetical protein [Corynebacterium pygosceleis]|uniref:Cell-surface hemin receptor n=1 Tax=Corynebacterium pygosceleis TaxID=2800406 RepID=A0A9Q4C9E4_9CORY|nr:hypothetical protein [Corynebacterium pygosceleis]MCK7637618.1 hypothetical protein [Corynebacterium pygosceleis]MCK7674809.1 hypothetical protein [Corynebacterium pygosceleis]MCL0119602.1 hypothetical protein [Corynebacterium pygosceleis]MCX7468053.1 hypothetical protein [Corynebacterium pygosceleis]